MTVEALRLLKKKKEKKNKHRVGKIPWTEEPSRLQSMGSLRVGQD